MSKDRWITPNQSPLRLVLILASAIFITEFGLMILFAILPALPPWAGALVDSVSLIALVSPIVYFFIFRPVTRHIGDREQAEDALRASHDQLEIRVRQRTLELELRNREMAWWRN